MDLKRINSIYKNERKAIRRKYREGLKDARARYEHVLSCYYSSEESCSSDKRNPPVRPVLEEIGNSVTHGAGSLYAAAMLAVMLIAAKTAAAVAGAIIYFLGAFIMFTMSCLYHAFPAHSSVKRLFRRFDYSSIYLLIGATFAPILLECIGGAVGIVFFIIQWAVIITGITFVGIFGPGRLRWLHIPLYLILGWSGLMLIPGMLSGGGIGLVLTILGGGVTYTLGIIPFALKRGPSHFIWHFFVLLGALIQGLGIYFFIYL